MIFRAAVKVAMEEEETVTQEQFNAMMAEVFETDGDGCPADWSPSRPHLGRKKRALSLGERAKGSGMALRRPGRNRADALAAEPAEIAGKLRLPPDITQ